MERFRQVPSITMKRMHVHLMRDDKYGHWWFEIGNALDSDSESYGWWPQLPVTKTTFVGVGGELNGQSWFNGEASRDPHHGDDADEEFHPWIAEADTRSHDAIADCLRKFARSYHGEWQWLLGSGQNCQTFQLQAMRHCGLWKSPSKSWF